MWKARQGAAGTQGGAVEAERHPEGRARDIQQLEVTWGGQESTRTLRLPAPRQGWASRLLTRY